MSLVAYGSSDESSDEEVNPTENNGKNQFERKNVENPSIIDEIPAANAKTHLNLPVPKKGPSNDWAEIDPGKRNDPVENRSLDFAHLLPKPKPKNFQNEYIGIPEDDDIPLYQPKPAVIEKPTKKERGPAKISIPSLSEFKDVEEDLETSKNKPTASKKGIGLFSLLPPPKAAMSTKKNTLIPHVLTKNMKTNSSITKISAGSVEKPVIDKTPKETKKNLPLTDYESNSEDDEDAEHLDFFSLSKPKNLPEIDVPQNCSNLFGIFDSDKWKKAGIEESRVEERDFVKEPAGSNVEESANSTLTSTVMDMPREEILLKNKAEVGPKLPIPEQEYNIDSVGNVAFDEKAIEYLCGKRGVKRKNKMMDEVNIIEINGEDVKPDEREWLVKALTEEPVQRPVSMQGAGPSSQSKKKHQITYLAHQAKAMEVELKNTWSQNRMTRQQTQSKYGF